MAIRDRNLEPGTRLVANYKKQPYVCVVDAQGDRIVFVLEDGRRFKSPSSAGSAVMGGKAVNGWRFWTVAEGQLARPQVISSEPIEPTTSTGKRLIYRLPNQKGVADGMTRYFCNGCQKSFIVEGQQEPGVCLEGHQAEEQVLAV